MRSRPGAAGLLILAFVSWETVRELFVAQVEVERLHPGAALAVYHRGRLVLDQAVGLADAQRGVRVGPETLFALRSPASRSPRSRILQLRRDLASRGLDAGPETIAWHLTH